MEVLAQALTLPLDDITITINALNIYLTWLTIESKRPKCIFLTDAFFEKILRHLSLIFNPKKVDNKLSAQSIKHIESCRLVLRAFVSISMFKNLFSFNIKKILLKILLGITDNLLKPKQGNYLSDELCDQLLASLLEIWLRCEILSKSLWIQFNNLYPSWTHHLSAITQWSEIIFALTDKVNKYLYTPELEKSKSLTYNTSDNLQIIIEEMQDQFIFYAWQQMIVLIGDPQNLSASIFLKAVIGLDKMIQLYLFSLPVDYRPDSNTILFLLGKWLFNAVNIQKSECIDGRAQAFGVLCRIFCRYQKYHPIKSTYLNQFYASISETLSNPKTDLLIIIFIIVNGEDIFVHGLPGARLLQPCFIKAIRRIIPKIDNFNSSSKAIFNMSDLRKSCYKLLSTIFGTIEHFDTDVTGLFEYNQQLSSYSSSIRGNLINQKGHAIIIDILVGALVIEKDVSNIKYLMNLIISISWNGNAELLKTIIRILVDCIPTWSLDASLAAVEVLRVMKRSDFGKFSLQTIHLLLSNMMMHPISSGNVGLIASLFECMFEWISISWRQFCIDQELQTGTFQVVCKAIHIGLAYQQSKAIEIKKQPSPVHDRSNTLRRTESVTDVRKLSKRASSGSLTDLVNSQIGSSSSGILIIPPELILLDFSETVLFKLLHILGNQSVNPFCPMQISSKHVEDFETSIKYYLVHGRSLVAFQEKNNSELLITTRTAMGKFSWELMLRYYDSKQKIPNTVQECWPIDPISMSFQEFDFEDAFAFDPKLMEYQAKADYSPIDALENIVIYNNQSILQRFGKEERRVNSLSCIDSVMMAQFSRMKDSRINEGIPVASYRSRTPNITSTIGILDRLFISESGLGQLSMISKALTPIPNTPDLQAQISFLDTIPERFLISCAVYYVRSGKQNTFQILTDKNYSIDFAQFLNALGWPLDLGELVFWADVNYEIKYYLPQLIYKGDIKIEDADDFYGNHSIAQISPEITDKIGDSCVTIFWIDRDQDDLAINISQKLRSTALIFLCIQPLKAVIEEKGLYRIRVLLSNTFPFNSNIGTNDILFSPLLDGIIIERQHLAGLIRETVISCNRYCQNILQAKERPWIRRMRIMREITKKYRDNQSVSKFYNELLTTS